jgi:Ni,Fe-hydrogenase I cytochrome b subunit
MFLPRVQLIDSGLFDVSASIQDWPTWLALAAKHGIEQRAELTAAYTIHDGAGTNLQFHDAYLLELVTLLENYAVSFSKKDARSLVSNFIFKWILAGAHRAWRSGDIPAMRQRLAMTQSPAVQQYRCPVRWTPLLSLLYIKTGLSF